MHLPKVSVIMPAYNGEKYIAQAIESILHQTFQDFELVVVDDGSTDRTREIISSYTDSRIRLVVNTTNVGIAITRNNGIQNSKGKYIAMLDCDDISRPSRLQKQVNFLDENLEYGLIGSSINIIGKENEFIKTHLYQASPAYIPSILLFHNYFSQSTIMIRREALPPTLYNVAYPPAEDYGLWVTIAANWHVGNLEEVLVHYRVHDQNISASKAGLLLQNVKLIQKSLLHKLGIKASDKDLDLHLKIGQHNIVKSKDFVKEAERWLIALATANKNQSIYNTTALQLVIFHNWCVICKLQQPNIWVFRKFFASPLFDHTLFIKYGLSKINRTSLYA